MKLEHIGLIGYFEAGFEPWMAAAIAEKHDWVARLDGAGRPKT